VEGKAEQAVNKKRGEGYRRLKAKRRHCCGEEMPFPDKKRIAKGRIRLGGTS